MNRTQLDRSAFAAGIMLLAVFILIGPPPALGSVKEHRLQVGTWLLLGPIETPLPAFAGEEPEWWNDMYPPIDGETKEPPGPIDAHSLDLGDYGAVVMGEVSRDRILVDLPDWDSEFYDYEPDPALIGGIADHMQDVEITVLLGTWCSDSRREIPRLWKILYEIGYPTDEVTLYAVGSSRFTNEMPIPSELLEWSNRIKEHYGVERVATIILYRDGEEIGRIVETPKASLEGDLLEMLLK